MDIQINEKSVRAMAERLRTSVGADQVSQGKALETLAAVLGFKNWDTLSGTLRKKASRTPAHGIVLGEPVELLMSCFCTNEFGSAPAYGKVTLTQQLVDRIFALRALASEHNLSELRDFYPIEWGGQDPDLDEEWRMELEELVVGGHSMWFLASPKHANYNVETRAIELNLLKKVLSSRDSDKSDYLVWHKGHLVFSPDGEVDGFIDELKDYGEL